MNTFRNNSRRGTGSKGNSRRGNFKNESRSEGGRSFEKRSSGERQQSSGERSFNKSGSFGRRNRSSFGGSSSQNANSYGGNSTNQSNSFYGSSSGQSNSYGGGSNRSGRSYGGGSSRGRSFGGGGRGRSSGGRSFGSGGRRGRFFRGPSTDPRRLDKYINKITKTTEQAPYISENTFKDFDISDTLKRNIEKKKFIDPTAIQDQAIPHILQGKDVLGIANTGTGKTGAFLIPLIEKATRNNNEKVLIIVPTRELAQQIKEELFSFTDNMRIRTVMVTGGANMRNQMDGIRRGFNFVVGTPGRLKDLSKRGVLELDQFSTIVLDEVDRMLDMGFIEDITFLLDLFPEKRQSLFFSATVDKNIEKIMMRFLKDHVTVSVKTGETAKNIHQDIIKVKDRTQKKEELEKLLKNPEYNKILIFLQTKRGVDELDRFLFEKGYKVTAIHGDKRQRQRNIAIDRFKTGQAQILIATDVAARGLDVSGVSLVINYDEPATYDDYVHRIGRTGRANQMGQAITFIE